VGYHVPHLFFMSIADNSKIQTPQPLFGGYAPCTVPGISIRNADILEKLRRGEDVTLDLHEVLADRVTDGDWVNEFFARSVRPYNQGDVVTISFATGGAGYGDPLERDPKDVLRDLKAKKISEWSATNIYKVALSADGKRIDEEQTQALRDAERQNRLQRGRPYDEFVQEWSQKMPPESILQWFGAWPSGEKVTPIFRP
jgi:acetophenone carboxylase